MAELGAAAVRGLQGTDLDDPLRVLACAKHFVGRRRHDLGHRHARLDKRPRYPLDQGDTRLDEAELRRLHLQGYLTAHRGRCRARSCRPTTAGTARSASGSKRLLTEILKDELGLRGLPDLRLQRDRRAARRLPRRRQAVDQRRHGHGDGAEKYRSSSRTLKDLVEAGEVPDGAHRRRGAPHPAREVRDGPAGRPAARRWPTARSQTSFGSAAAPRRRAPRRARVAGAAQERQQGAAALEEGQAHPRGGQERRRHRQPVRRLDHHLAGPERRRHHPGHHDPRRDPARPRREHAGHLREGRHGRRRAPTWRVVVVGETPYAEFEGDRDDLVAGQGGPGRDRQRQEGRACRWWWCSSRAGR